MLVPRWVLAIPQESMEAELPLQVGGCRSCVASPVIGESSEEEKAVCGSWP